MNLRPASSGQRDDTGSVRLVRLLDRFEEAWRGGLRPAIEDYLPGGGVDRRTALVELVQVDLEYRMRSGEPACLDAYLGRYPELQADRAAVLDLIAAEYELRLYYRPGPTPEEYGRRFPQYREELRKRLDPLRPVAAAPPGRLRGGRSPFRKRPPASASTSSSTFWAVVRSVPSTGRRTPN